MSIYRAYGYLIQEAIKPDDRLTPLVKEMMIFIIDNIENIKDDSKPNRPGTNPLLVQKEFTLFDGTPITLQLVNGKLSNEGELGSHSFEYGRHTITIYSYDEDTQGKTLAHRYASFKDTLTHELFHATQEVDIDSGKMQSMAYIKPSNDYDSYIKNPKEVHAEFGAMIHKLVNWYKMQKTKGVNIPQTELWEKAKAILSPRTINGLPDYTIEKLKRAFFRQVQQIEGR